jgi:hypothetical protein
MGALLQILLKVLPAANSHDSETEGVRVDYNCALCGNVSVEENDSHESKEHHEQRGGVGG